MPYLRIYTPELAIEQKRQIAKEVTDSIVRALELPDDYKDHTTIHFIPFRLDDMAIGGRLVSDREQPHYQIEVYDRYLMAPKKKILAAELTNLIGRLLNLGDEQLGNIYIVFSEYAVSDVAIGGVFLNQM